MGYYLGIDIGGTTAKVGLFSSESFPEIIAKKSVKTDTSEGGAHILPDIAAAIAPLCAEAGIISADHIRSSEEEKRLIARIIDGIGVGVPGAVVTGEKKDTTLVNKCVNLGWGVKDAAAELTELTGVEHIEVINDANAAALAEAVCGSDEADTAGREAGSEKVSYKGAGFEETDCEKPANDSGADHLEQVLHGKTTVLVTIGTGIGGGIVRGRRVIRGAFGAAGEIGHMKIAPQHPFLRELIEAGADIRAFEDFEYYVSATGVIRLARASAVLEGAEGGSAEGGSASSTGGGSADRTAVVSANENTTGCRLWEIEDLEAKTVFDAAKVGDPVAVRIREFFFDTFGVGLAAVAGVIDPDGFIIGGGVSGEGQYLLDGIREAYRRYVFHASRDTDFRLAVLGNDAGMIGAANL